MKRVLLMFLLAVLGFASFAQDFDKVKNQALLKNYVGAKAELDKIMASPKLKDKTTATYWVFALNGMFYASDSLSAKYPGSDSLAFIALDDYEKMDTSIKAMKENNTFAPAVESIRITGFNNGVKAFNNKAPQEAYKSFNNALRADAFLSRHNFLPKNFVDTNIVLYTGYSAQNSGDLPNAVKNYKILIDNNIPVESKDFENSIYYVVLSNSISRNDQEGFQKYAAIIKKSNPQYGAKIDQLTAQNMTSNASLSELIAKYKQDQNLNETQVVAYAEAFAQPEKDELAKLDSAGQVDLKMLAAEAFAKAYSIADAQTTKPAEDNRGLYAYNAGILYYNVFQDLEQRFYDLRGESPALKAKRDALEKVEIKYEESAVTWFTNAYNFYKAKTDLSKREKSLLLNSVKNLANAYEWKKGKARGINATEYDKYDALYKQFDAETDKYSK